MIKLNSGHEVEVFDEKTMEERRKYFSGLKEPMIRVNPGGWVLPKGFTKVANKIYNFKLRKTDVVVMTFPKCGTTWAQEVVWTMRNNPNLDHPWASRTPMSRSPFLEYDMMNHDVPEPGSTRYPVYEMFKELCPGKNPEDGINMQLAEAIPDPRTIKTHLPFSLMPPSMEDTAKVVYVARNPKDALVSFHHFYMILDYTNFLGSFEDFVDFYVNDSVPLSPYWLHLKEGWEKRNHPNVHFIFFESMKENPMEELKKLNSFLGTNLTEEQLKGVAEYTSFENMRKRGDEVNKKNVPKDQKKVEDSEDEKKKMEYMKKEGGFYRKGVVGDWKNKLSPEMNAKVDKYIHDHLSDLGVNFRYGTGH